MQVSVYISVDLADTNMVIQVVSLMFYLDHHVLGIYWHARIQWQYDVPNCTLWLKKICMLTKEKIDPVGDTQVPRHPVWYHLGDSVMTSHACTWRLALYSSIFNSILQCVSHMTSHEIRFPSENQQSCQLPTFHKYVVSYLHLKVACSDVKIFHQLLLKRPQKNHLLAC